MTEIERSLSCPDCLKSATLCQCAEIAPVDNKIFVLILQHPQEQDRELGTARLAATHFKNARVVVGLSWANLTKALGKNADPKKWGVLYLGPIRLTADALQQPVVVLDRNGNPLADPEPVLDNLGGIILLDGSWSQAKALWWRNAWLLKTRRIVLNLGQPSRYGKLRKEPRQDSVSTLEATAFLMGRLERKPELESRVTRSFEEMLRRYRASRSGEPVSAPAEDRTETV